MSASWLILNSFVNFIQISSAMSAIQIISWITKLHLMICFSSPPQRKFKSSLNTSLMKRVHCKPFMTRKSLFARKDKSTTAENMKAQLSAWFAIKISNSPKSNCALPRFLQGFSIVLSMTTKCFVKNVKTSFIYSETAKGAPKSLQSQTAKLTMEKLPLPSVYSAKMIFIWKKVNALGEINS